MELLAPESRLDGIPPGQPATGAANQQHTTWRPERFPARLELAWRPYRPELPVQALTDVTVAGRQVMVSQRLQFQFAQPVPRSVSLVIPAALAERLRVTEGGTLQPNNVVQLTTAPTGRDHTLTLVYSFPLPEKPPGNEDQKGDGGPPGVRRFPVPLVG